MANSYNLAVDVTAVTDAISDLDNVVDAVGVIVSDIRDVDLPAVKTDTGNIRTVDLAVITGAIGVHKDATDVTANKVSTIMGTDLPLVKTDTGNIRSVDVAAIRGDVAGLNDLSKMDLKVISIKESDNLIHSHDAEVSTIDTSYVKKKEIYCGFGGKFRVKFDLKSSGTGTARAKIYKNEEALGIEQTDATVTYTTKSQDLDFAEGDLLQIYLEATSSYTSFVCNLRICGDIEVNFANVL